MSEPTIFDKIVAKEIPSWPIWEDDKHLAFLSLFGNTPGYTVVVPKNNPGDNFITVDEAVYTGLLLAARNVAALLKKALQVERVGLVIEGEAVPHLHIKLIPMGADYHGHLNTADGPRLDAEELDAVQARIKAAT